MRRGLRASLQGYGTVNVPGVIVDASDAGKFVAEGEPLPVNQFSVLNPSTLSSKKFGCIVAYTRTLANGAVASFETILRQLLVEAASLGLDAALFSETAASADRPGGLLAGVVAETPTAGGGQAAFVGDMKNLAGALATAADVVIIAPPEQAVAAKNLAGPRFDLPILTSMALPDGTVIAIDAGAFVSGFGPDPQFLTTKEALVHMADDPVQIGTPGAPPGPPTNPDIVAAPSRSLFQTDCYATRMLMDVAWGMRAPSISFVEATTW
jgi:hypothetical protein